MTTRMLAIALVFAAATSTLAQGRSQQAVRAPRPADQRPGEPATAPAPASGAGAPAPQVIVAPRREGQPVNVKVDVTITDQRGNAAAIKRTVSVVVADGRNGMIRSQSSVYAVGDVPLNIDVEPTILSDSKIRVGFNLQYDWPAPFETPADKARELPRGTVIKTALHDNVALILESGKPMIAAQSADPIGDRQVTVEVKATVLR
jgi:hypothetical protein